LAPGKAGEVGGRDLEVVVVAVRRPTTINSASMVADRVVGGAEARF